MILCIILSVISVLPQVQEHLPFSGLLQSSCITLYILVMSFLEKKTWVNFIYHMILVSDVVSHGQ